jgi:excisionase family DNA binding protein
MSHATTAGPEVDATSPLTPDAAVRVLADYVGARWSPATKAAHQALDVLRHLAEHADDLLSPADVATQLRISTKTVYRLIDAAELNAIRVGYRTLRVPARSLASYRDRHAQANRATR